MAAPTMQGRNVAPSAFGRARNFILVPSGTTLAIAVVVAIGWLAGLAALFTERFVRESGEHSLVGHRMDYDLQATVRGLTLRRRADPRPLLVLVGNSQLGAAVKVAPLEHALAADLAAPPETIKLVTAAQSVLNVATLVSCIPDGSRGLLLLGVSPFMLARDLVAEHRTMPQRLGLRSVIEDAELERLGFTPAPHTGVYAIDDLDFLLARRTAFLQNLVRTPPQLGDWDVMAGQRSGGGDFNQRIRDAIELPEPIVAQNWEILARVVEDLRRRTGVEVLLVETPISPATLASADAQRLLAQHRTRRDAFVAREHVDVLDLIAESDLRAEEFLDWGHVRDDAAVARVSALVARRVGKYFAP